MLDDLRNSANQSFGDEQQVTPLPEPVEYTPRQSGPFLGMSPQQRFVVALMLLLMVCVLGVFALIASGAVVPPV